MPLNNFGIINQHLFRSAQPNAYGYQAIDWLGVRNVIRLNMDAYQSLGHEAEAALCVENGMQLIFKPLPEAINSVDSIMEIASLLDSLKDSKTLVHCEHGRDRTGLVIGAYRILYQGWDVAKADAERKAYGVEGLIQVADLDMEFVLAEIFNRHNAA